MKFYFKQNDYFLLFDNPLKIIKIHEQKNDKINLQSIENFFYDLKNYNDLYFAGFISYEVGKYLLPIKKNNKKVLKKLPLIFGGFFKDYKILQIEDEYKHKIWINHFCLLENFANYSNKINYIKNLISEGKVYQMNLTFPIKLSIYGSYEDIFFNISPKQKTDFLSLIYDDELCVISFSPELFFMIQNNQIVLKPMKGTRKKIHNESYNVVKEIMHKSEKERAENAMIVDLIRNDLGRISKTKTIYVKDIFKVEEYETIYQMTTTIQSELVISVRNINFWKSLFPSGSVTGAPKISAMNYIEEIEKFSREVYTGAIGWIDPENQAKFNVAIRTLLGIQNEFYFFVGSGITFDSQPKSEWKECLAKISFLKEIQKQIKPRYIFTTMKFCGGIIFFEKSHLQRLQNTLDFFCYPLKKSKIIYKINKIKRMLKKFKYPVRIHFRIYQSGKVLILLEKLIKKRYLKIKISQEVVTSNDIFLFYKTSERNLYNKELQQALKEGYDEVIFFNEHDWLTEGSFTNIIIRKEKQYYTPDYNLGLLNGILRNKLIRKKWVKEMKINKADLKDASEIILINAVRGGMRGKII